MESLLFPLLVLIATVAVALGALRLSWFAYLQIRRLPRTVNALREFRERHPMIAARVDRVRDRIRWLLVASQEWPAFPRRWTILLAIATFNLWHRRTAAAYNFWHDHPRRWVIVMAARIHNYWHEHRYDSLPAVSAIAQWLTLPIALATIAFTVWRTRRERVRRRERKDLPRLVWGPYPNMAAVEIAKGLRRLGYVCDSVVFYNFGRIWKSSVFTYCLTDDLAGMGHYRSTLARHVLYHYRVFLRVLRDYDIVHGCFYEGYLRETPLARFEVQLLQLAGCKQITTSVGADVAYMTDIESHIIRQGMNDMYPELTALTSQRDIKRRIDYYTRHSDYIICQCSYMIDVLPRWDLLVTQYFPIDTDYWESSTHSEADGTNAVVTIGHSPNHRPLKGTNFLIKAVNRLRAEGLKVELVLLENHQNSDVRDTLGRVDIIVADVVLQGYALMGVEGLALGKPVVQDISDPHYNRVFKLYSGLDEAPFVSTPIEGLADALRALVTNPEQRREIGRKSRAYALKYHGYDANARFWQWVYDGMWFEKRERIAFYHPDWPIDTVSSVYTIRPTPDEALLRDRAEAELGAVRQQRPFGKIAFYPFTPDTGPIVSALIRTRVIRSNDVLLVDPGTAVPPQAAKWPQAVIGPEDLAAYGVEYVCRIDPVVQAPAAGDGVPQFRVGPVSELAPAAHEPILANRDRVN